MSIWGMDFFDNDMACDWENGISITTDIDYIQIELQRIIECPDAELDMDMVCRALAAADAIYIVNSRYCDINTYTTNLCQWAKEKKIVIKNEVVDLALQALEKVLSSDSELKYYWKLRGNLDEFIQNLNDLYINLKNTQKG